MSGQRDRSRSRIAAWAELTGDDVPESIREGHDGREGAVAREARDGRYGRDARNGWHGLDDPGGERGRDE